MSSVISWSESGESCVLIPHCKVCTFSSWYIHLTAAHSRRIQSYNNFLINKLRKSSYSQLQKRTGECQRMSRPPNVGTTLTGGIQDIAALLPLLGTDQCEKLLSKGVTSTPQPRLFQFSGVPVLSKSAYLYSFPAFLNLRFLSSSPHIPNSL